ncbi:MAG: sulfotransferase domain-containing protein [Salinibacter sp.]
MDRVNLFVIGVNKAGTSWLYYLLSEHPDVFMSDVKELYFFGSEAEGPADRAAYHRHFPFDEPYRYFGEATVMYYRKPAVAAEIEAYNPDAKLLAIVRDPIERLRSQYQYHKQIGLLDEETSLEGALDGRDPMLLRDSHYEETLPPFADRFGPEQFKVVSLEAGRDAPEALWTDLLSFLDLPAAPCPPPATEPENPTGSPAFRRVYRATVQPVKEHLPAAYEWMLQSAAVRRTKLALLSLLGTAEEDRIPSALRTRLEDEFAPTYAYLRDLGFDHYAPEAPED